MTSILIVETDKAFSATLRACLDDNGIPARAVRTAREGVEFALGGGCDLVAAGAVLPDGTGLDLLAAVRAHSDMPFMLMGDSGPGAGTQRILAFETGADDFLIRPFSIREFLARVRAVLRRAGKSSRLLGREPVMEVADLRIDPSARTVTRHGEPVQLTSAEFGMLELLVRRAGTVVTRDELSEVVLGRTYVPYDRSVDVHISSLRKKLGRLPGGGKRIRTVRGTGYLHATPPLAAQADAAMPTGVKRLLLEDSDFAATAS
ncbi:MAG: response regulator transcription factor [Desulfovibrionaceae bacterium]|jgi:two-component system response regulator CpxR|nr:response regulator transcription factor [Desulfovibrionaceae bacterium]